MPRAPPDHHDCLGGALAGPETLSDKGDDSRDRYDHSGFVGDNDDDVEEAGHVNFDLTGHDTAAAGGAGAAGSDQNNTAAEIVAGNPLLMCAHQSGCMDGWPIDGGAGAKQVL